MKHIYIFFLIFYNLTSSVFGHKDYAGDVYPFVFASNDTFIVQFQNNNENTKYISKYTADGQPIIERERIEFFVSKTKLSSPIGILDTTVHPLATHDSKWYQFINSNSSKRAMMKEADGKKNSYIIVSNGSEIIDTIPISFWKNHKAFMHSILVDDNNFIGVASSSIPSNDLLFFHANKDNVKEGALKKIGQPVMIWGLFPQVSNMLKYGKYALVVWIRKDKRLFITALDLETKKLYTHNINGIKEWNTKPQIAMIKDKMIICYHTIQDAKNGSEVRNLFIDFPFEK